MAFSNINFKFNDIPEAQELDEVVKKKLESFNKYLQGNEKVSVDVEFQKVASHHSGQIHHVEINIRINGELYRAEATEESFEKAIDEVKDELDKELRRAKEKQLTLEKEGGREAKKMLRNGGLE